MWLGERITDRGIGNGTSMIIMIGIISRLPGAFAFELQSQLANNGLILFIFELVILFLIIIISILIVQGVRKPKRKTAHIRIYNTERVNISQITTTLNKCN